MDVVLMKRAGRFSGEAYVVLPGMAQVEAALAKHKHYMGRRYVEVLPTVREASHSQNLKGRPSRCLMQANIKFNDDVAPSFLLNCMAEVVQEEEIFCDRLRRLPLDYSCRTTIVLQQIGLMILTGLEGIPTACHQVLHR